MSVEPPFRERPPAVPPTLRYAVAAPVRPPAWPLAIGIICIVLGAGGVFVNLFGLLSYTVLSAKMGALQPAPHVLEEMKVSGVLTSLLNVLVAVLLLVAGIGMAQRRRWSVALARVWAVVRILAVVVGMAFAMVLQTRQFAAMPAQVAGPFNMPKFSNAVIVLGMVFGLLWGWALPVFVLIWLNRGTIRQQTEGWK